MNRTRFFAIEEALKPYKKHPEDAGWDLRAAASAEVEPWKTAAIDTGVTSAAVPTDARGTKRPQGAAYDIGAIERIEL